MILARSTSGAVFRHLYVKLRRRPSLGPPEGRQVEMAFYKVFIEKGVAAPSQQVVADAELAR